MADFSGWNSNVLKVCGFLVIVPKRWCNKINKHYPCMIRTISYLVKTKTFSLLPWEELSILNILLYFISEVVFIFIGVDVCFHEIWNFYLKINFKIQTCLFIIARFSTSESLQVYPNI